MEQRIKEQRSIEANKKNLVGQNGKIGIVLKTLGQPIISQNEGEYFETNYLELYNEEKEEPKNAEELLKYIPIKGNGEENERPNSPEWSEVGDASFGFTQTIGWHFYGLDRGMHLEIKYDNFNSDLEVYHKGYLVYKESKGDIECYVPKEEWENWINHLYKIAKNKQKDKIKEELNKKKEESKENKNNWLEKMKIKWGME